MNKLAALLTGLLLLGFGLNANAAAKLQHVVTFKFKDTASKQDIQKVVDGFAALKQKIPQMKSFEWGTNISPEKLNKGFTHCFIAKFKSEKDRDAYLVHPAHKAFAQDLGPVLDEVLVID